MNRVLLLGGTGFIGGHILTGLLDEGIEVVVCTRKKQPKRGIAIPNCRIENLSTQTDKIGEVDAIVNAVGILKGSLEEFEKVHVEGVREILKLAEEINVKLIVHISALGVTENDVIPYSQTKGMGEKILIESGQNVLILRPSIVLGPGAKLIKIFKTLFKLSPLYPLFKEKIEIAPVYVGDLVEAVLKGLRQNITGRYDICGERINYNDFIELLMTYTTRPPIRPRISVNTLIKLSSPFNRLKFVPIGSNELELLKRGSVCEVNHLKEIFKIEPKGVEESIELSLSTKFS